MNQFVVRLLDSTHATLSRSVEGLADEQLWYRVSADANSIAWLAWHYSRWADGMTSKAVGEEDIWVSENWYGLFGLSAAANGFGDTPDQVDAFRPSGHLVMGYASAVHDACVRRVEGLSPQQILAPFQYKQWSPIRPLWQSLGNTVMDFTQHVGQIAYVRGLISGLGWR